MYERKLCLSVSEARALLDLGHNKFNDLIKSGEIRSIKSGGRRLIPARSLDDWIEQQLGGASDD